MENVAGISKAILLVSRIANTPGCTNNAIDLIVFISHCRDRTESSAFTPGMVSSFV
jgi:hypothetical protein